MRTSVLSPARLCGHKPLFALCVLILTAVLFGCSSSIDDDPDAQVSKIITISPVAMNVVPYNQTVTLSCTAESAAGYQVSYRWYESADGSVANGTAVEGATSSTLTLGPITEKGIRYFYCVATTVFLAGDSDDIESVAAISDVVSVAYTGLPTVYLDTTTPTYAITRDSYVQGTMKVVSEEYGDFSYTFSKAKEGVKGRGNSSWNMPKKGYNIKFDGKQSLFGFPEAKKWCIIANYSDKSLLRNKFASVLGTEAELFNAEWNPSFVSVDVVMNGEYLGNYIFCEKITLSDGRIEAQDISDCTEKKINSGKYTDQNGDGSVDLSDGGFILEIDARLDAEFAFYTTQGVPITLKDPDTVSEEIQNHIKTVVQTAEDALFGEDFADTLTNGEEQSKWMQYLDIDSFVDWYLVNEFAKNVDAPFWLSVYMYYDPHDRKLHLSPNWDFDIGFGNANYTNDGNTTSCADPTGWYIKIAKVGSTINWISRLFQDPRFVAKVKSRWNEKKAALSNAINSMGAFSQTGIQSLADDISVSADYNFMKWQILGVYIWPNAAGYERRTTYQSEVDYLIDWCNARFAWLDGAINGL